MTDVHPRRSTTILPHQMHNMIPAIAALLVMAYVGLAQSTAQVVVIHPLYISHLSPMIDFSASVPPPRDEQRWNTSLDRHETLNPDASITFSFFGSSSSLYQSDAALEISDEASGIDWHKPVIRTRESNESLTDVQSLIIRTTVPATAGQVYKIITAFDEGVDDIGTVVSSETISVRMIPISTKMMPEHGN